MIARARQLLVLGALLSGCGTPAPATGEPAPAFPTLTRRDVEPAGANCAHGGTVVQSGLDTNRSGMLEDREVAHTEYVCNGPVLVRMDPFGPNSHCVVSGTFVRSGVDRNGNGMLDDGEIEQTTIVCDTAGLWKGDFLAADWADTRKLGALMAARVVVGNLEIAAFPPVNLINLELVTGNLHVHTGAQFVKLPSLSEVDGDATIEATGDGATELPRLEHLGGDLLIDGPGAGADRIAAPLLTVLRGSLRFGAGLRGAVSVPAVKSVGGNVETVQGTGVTRISLSGLGEIVGSLAISGSALTALSIPLEHTIGRGVFVDSCPALTGVELGTTSIEGDLRITNAPALTTLAMPNLVRAREVDSFQPNIVMTDVGLAALEFPALQDTNGLLVRQSNALTAVRLPRLETVIDPHIGTEPWLWFEGNPALESVSAPEVTGLEALFLGSQGPEIVDGRIRELDFAKLTSVKSLMLIGGAKLPDLSGFPHLQDVVSLFLQDVDLLPDLRSLVSLRHVGEVALTRMPALTSLAGLEGTTELGVLALIGDGGLTDLAPLHDLAQVGSLALESDHALGDCSLPHLTTITSTLAITDMTALKDLSGLSAVRSVGGDILFDQNPELSAKEIADFEQQIGR
jgi:hypothetical protein